MAKALRSARWEVVLLSVSALLGSVALPAAASSVMLAATVVRVIDGDTVDVLLERGQERVRLIGIDTPESAHPEIGMEPWGPEASNFASMLLPPGTPVRLELDVQERDPYGRLLAYLYLPDGRMMNEVMLQEGLAQLLTIPPNVRYVDRFVAAQQQARAARKGIWSDEPFAGTAQVRIERVDLVGEEVVLVNMGEESVDLSGWILVSVAGNQRFRFPSGTVIEPGRRLVIRSGLDATDGPGVLVWTKLEVWNDEGDPAQLRDADGKLVSRFPE